jgi:hypothetical protein
MASDRVVLSHTMSSQPEFLYLVTIVNGTYACENDGTLNRILKHEIGFQGFVMSDWQGTMSTLGAEAGLDVSVFRLSPRGLNMLADFASVLP